MTSVDKWYGAKPMDWFTPPPIFTIWIDLAMMQTTDIDTVDRWKRAWERQKLDLIQRGYEITETRDEEAMIHTAVCRLLTETALTPDSGQYTTSPVRIS